MKYEGAFELVLGLLNSDKPSAQLTAIRGMGKLGDKRAFPYLVSQMSSDNPTVQSEAVGALARLGATETIPAMLNLLKDHDLYGSHSSGYHSVAEAFQTFGGIKDEIKNAFPGNYPAMFNMGGAPLSLPEPMGLMGNDQTNLLSDSISRFQAGFTNPEEETDQVKNIVRKTLEDITWKFGVMFADGRDAKQDRVRRPIELLNSKSNLTRAAAALTLPWYVDERAMNPLKQAAQDSDQIVSTAAQWAFLALQKTLLDRKQPGL